MTEEEARKKMMGMKVTPKRKGMTPEEAVKFYNQHLRVPVNNEESKPEPKEPWYLKPLLFLFAAFILFGMVSMCNHALKECSDVGTETTIKSHGD